MAKKVIDVHCCGDCANITPVYDFHTLSVKGDATLGECVYWTESKRVLLSWKSDCKHYRRRV